MKNNKYMDIYNFLKELIINKKIKPGEKIPSESQLTTKFNVSRNTARRAITMLINEGLVNSIHGKGVFILENSSPSF
ncbi:MAG: winged helix-turn-helix domain-containing protein, partial [Fusobacterium sp. JB020]|nr:winged helix-turn-helix domain-containing protein [Fusobacterium sp. JB020]